MIADKKDPIHSINFPRRFFSLFLLAAMLLSACQNQEPPRAAVPAASSAPAATEPPASTLPPTEFPSPAASATQTPAEAAPTEPPAAETAVPVPQTCSPTAPDALGPFYTPGAPVRDRVGEGYVLSGVVRSADGCLPIPGAQIDFWLAGPDGDYGDAYRAVVFAAPDGSYRFESHFPPPYSGRPSHIHLAVYAGGYQTLVTQHYPEQGVTQAVMDLVLIRQP